MESIWHVTFAGEPARLGPEGFLHASFESQLAQTLAVHFPAAPSVVLLRLDPSSLGVRLVVEPSRGGGLFPHVYGPILPADVLERRTVARGADGRFALGSSGLPSADAALLPLAPRPVARRWGGRRLGPRLGWTDCGEPTGEWWFTELRSGGALSAWLDGPGAARRLPHAADFPLLVKLLDTAEILSLQVHPDDAVARLHGLPRGKTEAWYVLQAEPEAFVYLGTRPGVAAAELIEACAAGASDEAVRALLRSVPLHAGDTLLVPAGTVHAVGSGVVLYELQQNLDVTYRIHDWGRGRELHLAEARQAARDDAPPQVVRREPLADGWTTLLDAPAFRLRRGRALRSLSAQPTRGFGLLTVLAGNGEARAAGLALPLAVGDTSLLLSRVELSGEGLDVLLAEPG